MTRTGALIAAFLLTVAACASTETSPSSSPRSVPPQVSASLPVVADTPAASPTLAPTPSWNRLEAGTSPAPREDHTWTVDAASGTAWLFGGRDRDTVFDDLWSYDLTADRWTRAEPAGDAPAARFGHTGTWVDGVGLIVWSGQSGGDFFADIHAYNPAANRWTRLPDAGAVPDARYGSCAALGPDGRLWVSHGFTFTGRFADTRHYDFETRAWTEVTPADAGPVKRCLHDCIWTPDGQLVLYAGQTNGVAALADLWTLDITGGWTEAPAAAAAPPARQLYALASTGPSGWVFGGRGLDGKALDDLWALELETLAWRPVEPSGEGPDARGGATLIADPARSRLLLFGGVGAAALGDTWQLQNVSGR